jgi:hypothetical protein
MDNPTYDTEFIKGFNEGYLIAKHLPDLADSLAQVKNETPRIEGFRAGHEQFVREEVIKQPGWHRHDHSDSKEKGDIERDKDFNKE